MSPVELVFAVGGEDERGHRADTSREDPEDVERRLVGPVQVLEHEHRGALIAKHAQQRGRHLVGRDPRGVQGPGVHRPAIGGHSPLRSASIAKLDFGPAWWA
jgi:hypothetical protein